MISPSSLSLESGFFSTPNRGVLLFLVASLSNKDEGLDANLGYSASFPLSFSVDFLSFGLPNKDP